MAQYGVSFVAFVTAYDSTTGTYKTGDAANIALRWTKDGTNSATTNSCSEVDATNSPGLYKVTMTATEATCTTGQLSGKSSTATTIIITGAQYHFDAFTTVLPVGTIAGLAIVDNGALQAATSSTAQLRSGANFGADDNPVGMTIEITSGTGFGQSRQITAYTNATDTATVSPNWKTTPATSDGYVVYPTPQAPTSGTLPSVNVAQINAVATTSVTAVNANVGTTQPLNFTGAGASALVKGDTVDIAGAAVSTSTAQLGVNVVSAVSNYGIKKNTQLTAYPFLMTDSTNHNPATGLTVTATRSLDGAAFASCANSVVEVSNGWYKITLAAGDLNGNTVALKFTATGADQANHTIITSP